MNDSKNKRFEKCVDLPVAVETAFAYHERVGALQRLIPPWESVMVQRSDNSLRPGSEVVLRTSLAGIPLRWLARHELYEPPHRFSDVQVSGPFAHWHHEHRFNPGATAGTSQMCDSIEYRLPGGAVGWLAGGSMVRKMLDAMFAYRHRTTRDDLQMFADHDPAPQRIAVSGASGLVGSCFRNVANLLGHRIDRLQRGEPSPGADEPATVTEQFYPWSDAFDPDSMDGIDAVVHLAGKSIADARWTDKVKQEIMDSRVLKTRRLCEGLAKMRNPPKVLVCASAIGIYGDRGDELLDDESALGDGFLADVGKQWEEACHGAQEAGIRVVNLRIGIVVSPQGGALAKLLLPAKLGVNGPVSNGKQWWSWVSLDDVVGIIYHAIKTPSLQGSINTVAPNAMTSGDFARTLGHVLHRPAILPAPAPMLRLALGEMADALLLSSTHVLPTKLIQSGYRFRFNELQPCLRHVLGKA